jgi:hypothetical protein
VFPLIRPCGGEFEPWLAAHATSDPDDETIETGIARLTEAEPRAIIDAYAARYPDVWSRLAGEVGGADTAEPIAIAGAVTAALTESREPYAANLAWIVDGDDPAEALALALDGTNLWSIVEATLLDEALAAIHDGLADDVYERVWDAMLDEAVQVFWSDAHERRLDILIERLRVSLPTLKPEPAARVLADAYDAFAEHEDVRCRLAALLLADTLDELTKVTRAAAA